MANFVGDEFVGIDNDAFGDGQDDTLPLDQWLQNRLYGNLRYLNARESVAWCPLIANSSLVLNAGDRPFGSITEWQHIRRIHWPRLKGLTGWTWTGLYNVQSEGATQDDVEFQIEIDGRLRFNGPFVNTDNVGAPSFEDFRFDIDLPQDTIPTEDSASHFVIDFYIRSTDGGNTGVDADVLLEEYNARCEVQANTFFNNSTAGNPANTGSLEVQFMRTEETFTAEEVMQDDYDLLFTFPKFSTTKPGIAGITPPSSTATGLVSGVSFVRRFLNYIQLRGVSFEPKFAAEAIPYIAQAALRAKVEAAPLVGQVLRNAVDRLQTRLRTAKVGPEGFGGAAVPEYYKDLGYSLRWPYVLGDEVTPKTLVNDFIWLDAEDPSVVITCDFIAVQFLFFGRGSDPGLAAWDFTVQIQTLPDVVAGIADWDVDPVTKATDSQSIVLQLHGAAPASPSTLLRQLHWMQGASPDEVAESMHKEGTMYRRDLKLIESVPFTLDLKNFDNEDLTQRGVRLKIAAELDPTVDPVFVSGSSQGASFLRLVLLNYTVSYRG